MYNISKSIHFVSVPVRALASGKNRQPGDIPGRYRRCMHQVVMLRVKASHWETGKAANDDDSPSEGASQKTCLRVYASPTMYWGGSIFVLREFGRNND